MVLLPPAIGAALAAVLAVPLSIDLVIRARATAEHDGTATIRGTLTCSTETQVMLEGQLVQSIGRSETAAGSFATQVWCGTTATPWAATITSDTGMAFRPGFALADLQAVGFDPETGIFSGVQSLASVRLTRSAR